MSSVPLGVPEVHKRVDDGLEAAPVFELEHGGVRLLGSECTRCSVVAFPARVVCLICFGRHRRRSIRGTGHVHSWTRLANPPAGFVGEMFYGCCDLDEGPRVLAPLVGAHPSIGAAVHVVPAPGRDGAQGFAFEVR